MRILHLDAGREMRGGQWQALRLIEGLAAAGVESTLLAREGFPLFVAARKGGWRVEPLGLFGAVRHARRHDLMHAHDARTHTLGAIVRGAPLVVARRVAFPVGSRWKYSRAARYIAVSQHVKGLLLAGGVPEQRIDVVYDGVPVLEQAQGDLIVTPANAHDPRKGAPLAAEAAALAGVTLTASTDLSRDLLHAGIFVYITHAEGLGSAALLAMSAGVPVIASNIGGLPEIVRHRETGLIAENEPAAIAAAIRELRADPEFARQLGAEGRRAVRDHFTLDHMVRRTMEVYRQVLV
jgi:hypothetical protein